jgi:CBS domain-containing protein
VRELINWWGLTSRGYRLCRPVEADLANYGLTTEPRFRDVRLDTTVRLIAEESVEDDTPQADQQDHDDAGREDIGIKLGHIQSAVNRELVSVNPNSTINEALTLMLLDDYSQLPVLNGPHNLRGAVTWRSILKAQYSDAQATLSEATVEAKVYSYGTPLLEVLPVLEDEDYVFVHDDRKAVIGIVTAADVAGNYRETAASFLLIGEIDRLLRRIIAAQVPFEEVTALCATQARPPAGFDELSFGDYQQVLGNPAAWQRLAWPLDHKKFIKRLDRIRELRNDVLHFNSPDPMAPEGVHQLREFSRVLRQFGKTDDS